MTGALIVSKYSYGSTTWLFLTTEYVLVLLISCLFILMSSQMMISLPSALVTLRLRLTYNVHTIDFSADPFSFADGSAIQVTRSQHRSAIENMQISTNQSPRGITCYM